MFVSIKKEIQFRKTIFFYMLANLLAAALLIWLQHRASDREVAGSMPVLGITSLCPWERRLTLSS